MAAVPNDDHHAVSSTAHLTQQPPLSNTKYDLVPPPRIKHTQHELADDAGDDNETSSHDPDADSSAHHGTRARNRRPRVNYSDDKELDREIEDYEAAGRSTKGNVRKAAAVAKTAHISSATPINGFSVVNPSNLNGGDSSHAKDQASATATKKRKQPGGASATASGATTPFALGPRLDSQPAHYVVSNVMSFSKSRARLNAKKQLIADDGTTLTADGGLIYQPSNCAY